MNVQEHAKKLFVQLPPTVRHRVLHMFGRYAPWEEGFDFTPPPPAPDESAGPPDFVGIGAQKAGTTWWYQLLLTHPGISSRKDIHKERHFLDRFGTDVFGPDEIERYHGWFPRRAGTLAGEWTPDYLTYPWAPALLRRAAPHARLLLLLRDPVERFCSGLAHYRRHGGARDTAAVADAIQRGLYYLSLLPWLEQFGQDQLLVLQYERCLTDTDGQLAATFQFLGLTEYYVSETERPPGTPPGLAEGLDQEVRERMVALYAPDVSSLAARFPGIDLRLWPNFAYLSGKGSVADGAAYSPMPLV